MHCVSQMCNMDQDYSCVKYLVIYNIKSRVRGITNAEHSNTILQSKGLQLMDIS
jgi:hypothetical protein